MLWHAVLAERLSVHAFNVPPCCMGTATRECRHQLTRATADAAAQHIAAHVELQHHLCTPLTASVLFNSYQPPQHAAEKVRAAGEEEVAAACCRLLPVNTPPAAACCPLTRRLLPPPAAALLCLPPPPAAWCPSC
jgi:hypothetical protein